MLKIKNNKGFTIIELIISIAIIGIIAVPLLGLLLQSTKNNTNSNTRTKVVAVSQRAMEWYKSSSPSKTKIEEIIAYILYSGDFGKLNDNDSVKAYIFYKNGDNLENKLFDNDSYIKNNWLGGGIDDGLKDYNYVKSLAGNTDYDLVVEAVLTFKNDAYSQAVQIIITSWDKLNEDKSKVRLISLRGN